MAAKSQMTTNKWNSDKGYLIIEEEGPSKCLIWSIGLKGVENYAEKEF